MQRLLTWEFRSASVKSPVRIMAIDGHSAWEFLAEMIGRPTIPGCKPTHVIDLPHDWAIYCVCPCGKSQSTAYCSEACYNADTESSRFVSQSITRDAIKILERLYASSEECPDCQSPINTDPRYAACDCQGMSDMLDVGLRMSGLDDYSK